MLSLAILVLGVSPSMGATGPVRGTIQWDEPISQEPDQVLVERQPGDLQVDVQRRPEYRSLYSGSRLYTMHRGEALVVLAFTNSTVRVGPLSEFYFNREFRSRMELLRGAFHFLARGQPFDWEFVTPHVTGGHRGTDFVVTVTTNEAVNETVVTLLDGQVDLKNRFVSADGPVTRHLTLTRRFEQAILATNRPPQVLMATNLVQWWLYYPAVIAIGDLTLDPGAQERIRPSLEAYATGDFFEAQRLYPASGTQAPSGGMRIYEAALALARGRTDEARLALEGEGAPPSLTNAIHMVIAAVTGIDTDIAPDFTPTTASEWLGYSYLLQSRHDLDGALRASMSALRLDPSFAYARIRTAELHFMRGERREAGELLEDSESLSRHAGYHTLQGFLRAAEGLPVPALANFQTAIDFDPALGDAWLGRGLSRIRQGGRQGLEEGIADLKTAAAAEPNRALLRSYRGKAFQMDRDFIHAGEELELAQVLDPNDPTPLLYLALLRQQENRINEGIEALQGSMERNPNRQVYRAPQLLDQDRAVRGANLALLYRDVGLTDLSVREASKAIGSDYANSTAHLFLADSYNNLREARQADLRYETPWFTEFLMANLLAPVGAGTLSPTVTANEYSRLFDRRRIGVSSSTEYTSNGDWYQAGAVHGFLGRTDFAVDTLYIAETGERLNSDVTSLQFAASVKQQLSPDDDIFLRLLHYDYESGDVRRLYDDASASPELRVRDTREPEALLGYHRTWQPGHHTLLLGAAARDRLHLDDPLNKVPVFSVDKDGLLVRPPVSVRTDPPTPQALQYESVFTMGSLEWQQIAGFEEGNGGWGKHRVVAGARVQGGAFDNTYSLGPGTSYHQSPGAETGARGVTTPGLTNGTSPTMDRLTLYLYDYWDVGTRLSLAFGLTYEHLRYPLDHRSPPLSDATASRDEVLPRFGFVVRPWTNGAVRAAYTRSLGGVSIDQSFRLEPTQVGGFNQSYRSLIPESVAGAVSAPLFETAEAAVDQQVGRSLFLTAGVAWRQSQVDRVVGAFQTLESSQLLPASLLQELEYSQREFFAAANWLIGRAWSLSLTYRLDEVSLEERAPAAHPNRAVLWQSEQRSVLHDVGLQAWFNSRTGFYAVVEARHLSQSNSGDAAPGPGDAFWPLNARVGYRFLERRADVQIGLLNLTAEDYRLSPLNLHPRFPKERTLTVSLRLGF